MTNTLVHIVTSDSGWILERLAKEIVTRLPYVTFGSVPDPAVPIQYYMTYGCRSRRVSQLEVAFFTHQEHDPATADHFISVARDVDARVAMSAATGRILDAAGFDNHIISPGVDLEKFRPKLKIAVVGRTYHTGRKGENLVNAVLDVPDIEWHFTGEGWPGPALNIIEADLPEFYRSMDYILVPATNEGGPMCVLEALASGVPVIGSDVGWVREFPHIPFEKGNPESLRAVLLKLREEKFSLRASVAGCTWDKWADHHDRLFRSLAGERLVGADSAFSGRSSAVRSPVLLSHGIESSVIGGPSVRVPRTAEELKQRGLKATSLAQPSSTIFESDLVHLYNLWPPVSAVRAARRIAASGKPLVFSPILLDFSEAPLWQADILRVFRSATSPQNADELLTSFRRKYENVFSKQQPEPEPGYFDALEEMVEISDAFIFLSDKEKCLAKKLLPRMPRMSRVIRNPVDAPVFRRGDPRHFRKYAGVQDYVLCVGRIEHRKNQLLLAHSLRETGLPLVLVGHAGDREYLELVKAAAGSSLKLINRLEPGSEMLRSAVSGARVVALPSWTEGAPLAALEAGAAGAKMVLSDRSSEKEYFGKMARYCDPGDPSSIRRAVLEAWDADWGPAEQGALADFVAQSYSWKQHVDETLELYDVVARGRASGGIASRDKALGSSRCNVTAEGSARIQIILDVTTLANNPGLRSGIVRVERAIGEELLKRTDIDLRFVVWSNGQHVEVSKDDFLTGQIDTGGKSSIYGGSFRRGARFVVLGSSWMQNAGYSASLSTFAVENGLCLCVLVHDFTPVVSPHWFPEGYSGRFLENIQRVLQAADCVLSYSENTKRDLLRLSMEWDVDVAQIYSFRLADDIGAFSCSETDAANKVEINLSGKNFILAVGGIHARKNYGLLYECWTILAKELGEACPHLVIAGGVMWNGADVARAMREDPVVSERIHIMDNVDDAGLVWLYKNCLLTVYPSLYEGWGLPVGESLTWGKICLASNRSSIPEIAPDLTDLLDPLDRHAWANRITYYVCSEASRKRREKTIREKYCPTSWSDSVDGLVNVLKAPFTPPLRNTYTLGDIVPFAQGARAPHYLKAGWGAREEWGCWAVRKNAKIEVKLAAKPDEDLVLVAIARYPGPSGTQMSCGVSFHGRPLAGWRFSTNPGASSVVCMALLPADVHLGRQALEIELACELSKPSDYIAGSLDSRLLGIGMTAFMVQKASRMTNIPQLVSTRVELRSLLRASPVTDLARALRTNAARPAFPMGPRPWSDPDLLRTFVRTGTCIGGKIWSEDGCIQLQGGGADIDASEAVVLRAKVSAVDVSHGGVIVVVVNGDELSSCPVFGEQTIEVRVDVPLHSLLKHDPIEIELASRSDGIRGSHGRISVVEFVLEQNNELSRHSEPCWYGVKGLPEFSVPADLRAESGVASGDADYVDVRQMMEMDTPAFLETSYRCILGREPDQAGALHYSRRLEKGGSRISVLAELRLSAEAFNREPTITGLDELVTQSGWSRKWHAKIALEAVAKIFGRRTADHTVYLVSRTLSRFK